MSKVEIIKKNTTLNGVSTTTLKLGLKAVILGLQGLIKTIESYERGEITEDQALDKAECQVKLLEAEINKSEFKALEEA